MPIDCLNSNVPVYDPDEGGCYRWMAVRAGQDSKFCANLEVVGDTTVQNIEVNQDANVIGDINVTGCINHSGCFAPELPGTTLPSDITCEEDLVAEAGDTVAEAIEKVSDYYCNRLDNLPVPEVSRSILNLQISPAGRVWSIGTTDEQLKWDILKRTSPDYAYGPSSGTITILTAGQYKFSTTLSSLIEDESQIPNSSKIQLFTVTPSVALFTSPPTGLILPNSSTFSGQDNFNAHTGQIIYNVPTVPFELQTGIRILDPPPTESVFLLGYTNITIERLGPVEPEIDVADSGGA